MSWAHTAFGLTAGVALSGGIPRSQPCVGSGVDSYQMVGHTGGKEKVAPLGPSWSRVGAHHPGRRKGRAVPPLPFNTQHPQARARPRHLPMHTHPRDSKPSCLFFTPKEPWEALKLED